MFVVDLLFALAIAAIPTGLLALVVHIRIEAWRIEMDALHAGRGPT